MSPRHRSAYKAVFEWLGRGALITTSDKTIPKIMQIRQIIVNRRVSMLFSFRGDAFAIPALNQC